MHFRKRKLLEVSLNEPIINDGEGNEISIGERNLIIESFEDNIVERETFEHYISVILNVLEAKERLIMLYKIAGMKQDEIAKKLNISQSYVSRVQKKLKRNIILYFTNTKPYKEPIHFIYKENKYIISFELAILKDTLPMLKNGEDRIVLQLPAYLESFSIIARFIEKMVK